MTDIRDVGDGYPIRYEARNTDTRALVDATVALSLTDPNGTTTTPAPTHTGTGLYDYTIPLTAAGPWYWRWDVTGTVTDVSHGLVYAQSPAPPAYATLDQLKTMLRITDTGDDAELQDKLVAASRRIDRDTGRRFWSDLVTSSRTYRPTHPHLLLIDDIASTTGLVVEVGRGSSWTTVASTGYDALPENSIARLWPVETLERVDACWPTWGSTRVRVTARWGWPAVPEPIAAACLLLAARLFRRKDSPEGVKGFSDMGVIRVSRYDSDYDNAIAPYVRTVT